MFLSISNGVVESVNFEICSYKAIEEFHSFFYKEISLIEAEGNDSGTMRVERPVGT